MTSDLQPTVVAGRVPTIAIGSDVATDVADPASWVEQHRDALAALVRQHGAVVVTKLGVHSGETLAAIRRAMGYQPAACQDQFAARDELADRVYSAPQWAADREQCLHHEQGYSLGFPLVLLMAGLTPARSGGALLLGDTRATLDHLPTDLLARFRDEGWWLERTFRPRFGLPWTTALGVASPAELEQRCAERDIQFEWLSDGTLRLRQHRSAVLAHPHTGEACWFNDIAFFSQFSVDAEERGVLLSAFGVDGLPFNTRFGDGEQLDEAGWQSILDAYDAVIRRVDWQAGDLVILDNVLTAHGREPFTGTWELAIAPAEPVAREPGSDSARRSRRG